ncbi:helix-turn-helix transcriptional regulator [Leifsonia xyli]|uniref:helix-turn-helix transcriptional regulator n=1 Tax=Leifsonia xyli TaxID=1575 RepID=UPI003D67A10F
MPSPLGEFLAHSRSRVDPSALGITTGGRRRVPGLRREEVAARADVSVDYYTRLEQGREVSPSPAVAESIGRALALDEHGIAHLYRLAGLTPMRGKSTPSTVDPRLHALLMEWREHPALILGHAFDVLDTNPLGEALFLGFPQSRNMLESLFVDPVARSLYVDWEQIADSTIAGFRLLESAQPRDPRIAELRDGLLAASPEFRSYWNEHRVQGRRLETKRFRHPLVGDLTLNIHSFDVRSTPGQELVVYRAEPGTVSARRLGRLRASLDRPHG